MFIVFKELSFLMFLIKKKQKLQIYIGDVICMISYISTYIATKSGKEKRVTKLVREISTRTTGKTHQRASSYPCVSA